MTESHPIGTGERLREPLAWEATTPCYTRWITDSRYRRLRPNYQRWYRPICPKCGPPNTLRKDEAE